MELGPAQGVLIANPAKKTAWLVMPDAHAYMDMQQAGNLASFLMPVDPDNPCPHWQALAKAAAENAAKPATALSCKRIGPETLGGRATIKYQTVSPSGAQGWAWIDPRLKFLVKNESPQGGVELRNIAEAAQPASLFVLPPGYRKVEIAR